MERKTIRSLTFERRDIMENVYVQAGVDIEAADKAVKLMKKHIESTRTSRVLSEIGSFSGLFDIGFAKRYQSPVLVQSVDGVGTKIIVAEKARRFDTIGQDIVNHCLNDILAVGAEPIFFSNYVASAKLKPKTRAEIALGMAQACRKAGIPIIGGETAEMPGVYQKGRHDVVGCITGLVEKSKIISGSQIKEGDILIGLPSNGLHTNGYSLARKVLFEQSGYETDDYEPELKRGIGEELLRIHKSYLPEIAPLIMENTEIHGIAHITGGGFFDNIGRLLSKGLCARIAKPWPIPPIFLLIQKLGKINDQEMRKVFNLGIGMVLIVPLAKPAPRALSKLIRKSAGIIGRIRKAESGKEEEKVIFDF